MSNYVVKDGVRYLFKSKKFPSLNTLYGVDNFMRRTVDDNLSKQTDYLKNNYVSLNGEKYLSFFEMSKSANIKPNQYFGEMFNKVSTLQEYARDVKFDCPVFMTITPPSNLKPLKQIKLKNNLVKLVDNPNFTGEIDYVNLAREYESKKWTMFLRQRLFKEIKAKYNERLIYMRTYEPMIDGTPHIHIVAFIPSEYKERFVKLAKNYFSDTRFDIKTEFNNNIGGVIAYILKYILKSFSNSKTNKLDDVGYWYAFHKIRRFTTSRTLIPMKYFRLFGHKEGFQNLLEVTKLYKKGYFDISVSINPLVFEITDYFDVKKSSYRVTQIDFLVKDFDGDYYTTIYEKSDNISIYQVEKSSYTAPARITHNVPKKPILVVVNHIPYFLLESNVLARVVPIPSRMKDYELMQYYRNYDIEDSTLDLKHFGILQNELIKRGLLNSKLQNVNDFNTNITN